MATETGRTIAFGVRRMAIQPLNNTGGVTAGIPIVIDTPEEVMLKFDVVLEDVRGGSYPLPIAADVKELKVEVSGKLLDAPPAFTSLLHAGTYTKNTTSGPALDALGIYNVVGSSVASRLSVTAAAGAVTGDYAVVATAANTYVVYDMVKGTVSASVTTSMSMSTMDTASVTGVTITTAMGTFTVNDAANFHIVNVGAAGAGFTAIQEMVSGPLTGPMTPPQARVIADCVRRNIVYRYIGHYHEFEGTSLPLGQGKYVVPDFKARLLTPPPGSTVTQAYRFDYVA